MKSPSREPNSACARAHPLRELRARTSSPAHASPACASAQAPARASRTSSERSEDGEFYGVALRYRALGWSIIPVKERYKKAACQWKKYQRQLPNEPTVRRWFARKNIGGLAVILGPVSGDLYCRDFDAPGAYEAWAAAHPELAARLPTVKTKKGTHVYFRDKSVRRVVFVDDGEFRGDGGYSVLPPSRHPDGGVYTWLIEPRPEGIPYIDAAEAELTRTWVCAVRKEPGSRQKAASSSSLSDSVSPVVPVDPIDPIDPVNPVDPVHPAESLLPERVMELARVTGSGQHDFCTMKLARGLKLNCKLTIEQARPWFDRWWKDARPHCRDDDPDAAWFKFERGWRLARIGLGQGMAATVLGDLPAVPLVPEAARFSERLGKFVSVLAAIGSQCPGEPFAISAHMVAAAFNVSPMTAQAWFDGLESRHLIKVSNRGRPGANGAGRARRIVWIGNQKAPMPGTTPPPRKDSDQ